VNLCFQHDLIRKLPRRTYSSKEITELRHVNNALEDSRRLQEALYRSGAHVTDIWGRLAPHEGRSAPRAHCQPLAATSVLHHLKDCISTIYSSRFDLRAQD
jgi:hypothetical protein